MRSSTFRLAAVCLISVCAVAVGASERRPPTIDDLLELSLIGGAWISPDGRFVAFTETSADFGEDAFVTRIWLAESAGGRVYPLTGASAAVGHVQWSPDGTWLSFQDTRDGGEAQVFAIRPDGGEARRLTAAERGVSGHAWSPDGRRIAFTAPDPDDAAYRARRQEYGDFDIVRGDYRQTHLWTLALGDAVEAPAAGTRLTSGQAWSVGGFAWSPDGAAIAFSAARTSDPVDSGTSDIYVLTLADGGVRPLVTTPGPDTNPRWSPDGRWVVFLSAMGNPRFYHANRRLAIVPASGGAPRSITDAFDENPSFVSWHPAGIYFTGLVKTASHLFRVDPASGRVTRVSAPDDLMLASASLARDGTRGAFVAWSATRLPEVHVAELPAFSTRTLTDRSAQIADWRLGTREVVSWTSEDGEPIDGVLVKPDDFDPTRRYPLLCVIHGGPAGIDRPALPDARYYPVDLWVAEGALVLKVNYRGSAGYGERFRQLNVRNLGVGDAWDVVSGIDALAARGHVDPDRLGCMGWSQGGYISAFLATATTRFRAISVGAGISNWATYYYNTDITPFTIQYLGADPAADPEVYRTTSPMSYILEAKTPTLIQHGEHDRRVPIANAYELRQGLEDRGVPVAMVVYKGFGHGITRPKAMRAVMEHNLRWFNHHLFDGPPPELALPAAGAQPTSP